MYKKKFESREEAYKYTAERINLLKNPANLLKNYADALQKLEPVNLDVVFIRNIPEVYQAFSFTEGEVSPNELVITEEGLIKL